MFYYHRVHASSSESVEAYFLHLKTNLTHPFFYLCAFSGRFPPYITNIPILTKDSAVTAVPEIKR